MLSPEIEATYEVLQTMGGGMGAVYKVRHRLFGDIRIIKVMQAALAENQALKDRFCAEARRGKQLDHRNIARVLDFQIGSNGNPHLFMEYIDGITVHDEFARRGGPLETATVVMIGVQTLAALDYLHSHNLIHRDISPDNLMIAKDRDGTPVIKLIDLGIAKSLEETAIVTRTGSFMGKITYASPEQSGGVVDARSDFYSLGVVLYELLTANKPIIGANTAQILIAHHQTPPRPFSETDPHGLVPEKLRQVVLKALAKKPEDRYQTATEFAAALQNSLAERTATHLAPAAPTVPATRPPAAALPVFAPAVPARNLTPVWPFVMLAALLMIIVGAGMATINRFRSRPAPKAVPIASTETRAEPAGSTIAVDAAPARPPVAALPQPVTETRPVLIETANREKPPEPSSTHLAQRPPINADLMPVTPVPAFAPPTTATAPPIVPLPATGSVFPAQSTPVYRDVAEGDRRRKEALAFSNAHQWENAVIAWRQFIHDYSGINPAADHAAWYNLGVAHESLRQWRNAADAFEHASLADDAIRRDTTNLLRLGHCYGKLGRWSDARAIFERVLRVDPGNDTAKRSLLYALQQEPRTR